MSTVGRFVDTIDVVKSLGYRLNSNKEVTLYTVMERSLSYKLFTIYSVTLPYFRIIFNMYRV